MEKTAGRKCFQYAPDIACWRITSHCNRHCLFCYGPETPDLKTADVLKIIDLLSQAGVRSLAITGGEPLSRPDIVQILEHIKARDMITCLTTNADFFQKYKEEIKKNIDVIGLPVEAGNAKIHDKLRGAGNFQNVLKALQELACDNFQIHIGTVLTSENCRELLTIEKLLAKFAKNIVYWKIYELVYYPDRKKQAIEDLVLEKSESYIVSLGQYLGGDKIRYQSAKDRSRSHFLINPNGDVIVPAAEGERTHDLKIGNLLSGNVQDIFLRWQKEVNIEDYHCSWCAVRFKKLPKFITYTEYPMDTFFRRIVAKAVPYYRLAQEYTQEHLAWMIPEALEVAQKENLDPRVLIPLVILHDIGYSQLPHSNPFDAKRRKDHMRYGAELSRKVLSDIGCSPGLIEKITWYVARHDNWSLGEHGLFKNDKNLGVLNDLDYISMLTEASFPFIESFLRQDNHGLVNFLESDEKLTNRPFVNQTTRQLFERCLCQQKAKLVLTSSTRGS